MELKCLPDGVGEGAQACSNRTFMELKYEQQPASEADAESSNRTFMELKSSFWNY